MSNDGTIHARAIRKSFGPKTVLKDIDLDIASGEICCIIGPSGSGKSRSCAASTAWKPSTPEC